MRDLSGGRREVIQMNKITALYKTLKNTRQEAIPLDELAKIFCEVFDKKEVGLFIELLEIELKLWKQKTSTQSY